MVTEDIAGPSIDVVDRFKISAEAWDVVDISLIVRWRLGFNSLSGVLRPPFSVRSSSKRSRDKDFSRSRDGVRDLSGFFNVLLGESLRSKSPLDPDGDNESTIKTTKGIVLHRVSG